MLCCLDTDDGVGWTGVQRRDALKLETRWSTCENETKCMRVCVCVQKTGLTSTARTVRNASQVFPSILQIILFISHRTHKCVCVCVERSVALELRCAFTCAVHNIGYTNTNTTPTHT